MATITEDIEQYDTGDLRMPNQLRGMTSAMTLAIAPLGPWMLPKLKFTSEERLDQGYVIVLPGIEGHSVLNRSVVCGLIDADIPYAVEIVDWTGGYRLGPVNLRWKSRNLRVAAEIAERISRYQEEYPGRPVHLVGHSGGGGISMLALESLPDKRSVETVTLLAPALSPQFDLIPALRKVSREVRNYYSPFDFFLLGAGTLAVGTIDGPHCIAAGARGFRIPNSLHADERDLIASRLQQFRYESKMARNWNFGGHFGCTNRSFARDWIAPLIMGTESFTSVKPVFSDRGLSSTDKPTGSQSDVQAALESNSSSA